MPRGAIAVRDTAHIVRFFRNAEELVEAVCDFATTGLELGDSIVLAVTNAHAARIRRELSQRGYHGGLAEISWLDAESLAGELLGARGVRPGAYERLIVGEVSAAASRARSRRVRAYGEIVDVLWKRGQEEDALSLERRWHETCAEHPLRLLCGYRLSLMDCRCLDIAQAHDLVEESALKDAGKVRRALEKVFGHQAEQLRSIVSGQRQLKGLPFEQAALMWISRHMPAGAARLAKALKG